MNLLQALLISTCMTGSKEESSGVAGIATKSFTLIIWLLISNWLLHVQFCNILIFPSYRWDFGLFFLLHRGGKNVQEEIIVAPATPAMNLMAAQLTDDNEDFANRGRYHQSEIVRGENFDDYDSNWWNKPFLSTIPNTCSLWN